MVKENVITRLVSGVGSMSRVLLPAAIAMAITGCSVGSTSVSLDQPKAKETASIEPRTRPGALGGEPTSRDPSKVARSDAANKGQRVAMANDKAPSGSFDKAPKGALSDRDYTSTKLDPDAARDLINQYRKEKGLKPLKLNAELSNAAKNHSRDLAKWDRISHFGSDGSNPWDRVKRVGYNARLAAENVGTGQSSLEEVLKGWKESPGHNKNLLLADAEHMGIALVQDPKTEFKTFWTLVLGSPL